MFPNEAYENDINRAAAAAYTEVLSTRPEFQKAADVEFIYIYKMDINQDGVLELLVESVGDESQGRGLEPYFLTYDGEVRVERIPGIYSSWDAILTPGLLPMEKKLILDDGGDGGERVQRFSMEDGKFQLERETYIEFEYEGEKAMMRTDLETEKEIKNSIEIEYIQDEDIRKPDALLYPSMKRQHPWNSNIIQWENIGN